MELKDFITDSSHTLFKDLNNKELELIKNTKGLNNKVISILKCIHDPEISVNIWDLGLIYKIDTIEKSTINIEMTLTSATCPISDIIVNEIKKQILHIINTINTVNIKIVWEPKWSKSRMSEDAKILLDIYE